MLSGRKKPERERERDEGVEQRRGEVFHLPGLRAERGSRLAQSGDSAGGRFDPRNQSERRDTLTAFRCGSIFDFVFTSPPLV